MNEEETVLQALAAQAAPASQLARISQLIELSARSPACAALCLVGSYAKGSGDRTSDLDLVALTHADAADAYLQAAHEEVFIQSGEPLLNHYAGSSGAWGGFRKYVYLDFSSCELYAFNLPTTFQLRRPYIALWDPNDLLPSCLVEGESPRHEEFEAYQHGDEGLIWELVDCIKWLQRGRVALTKDYLRKLVAKL